MKNEVNMNNGWSQEFDLQSVPDEVIKGILENIKMWDAALQKHNESRLKRMREEAKGLEVECKKLMGDGQTFNVPEPKYRKWYFCPCMNSGDGGFVVNE